MLRRLFFFAALCAITGCVSVTDSEIKTLAELGYASSRGAQHRGDRGKKKLRQWRTVTCAYPIAQCAEPEQEQLFYDALRTYFLRRRCTLVLPDAGGASSSGAATVRLEPTITSYAVTDTMVSPQGQSATLTVQVGYTIRLTDTVSGDFSVQKGTASSSRPKPRSQQSYAHVVRRCAESVYRGIASDAYRQLTHHERSEIA